MDNEIKKSVNKITKNLAGVYDALVKHGVTSTAHDHSHAYEIDRSGNGITTGMVGEDSSNHVHDIKNHEVKEAEGHTHYLI